LPGNSSAGLEHRRRRDAATHPDIGYCQKSKLQPVIHLLREPQPWRRSGTPSKPRCVGSGGKSSPARPPAAAFSLDSQALPHGHGRYPPVI